MPYCSSVLTSVASVNRGGGWVKALFRNRCPGKVQSIALFQFRQGHLFFIFIIVFTFGIQVIKPGKVLTEGRGAQKDYYPWLWPRIHGGIIETAPAAIWLATMTFPTKSYSLKLGGGKILLDIRGLAVDTGGADTS